MQNGWFIFPFWPLSLIFLISVLAETNRIPFDLPEAEAELVAGYNVEYSAFTFGSFFLGEYSNILMMASTFVTLFLGGGDCLIINSLKISLYNNSLFCITLYDFFFSFKIILVSFFFVFIRANFPRFRFDQLMLIG